MQLTNSTLTYHKLRDDTMKAALRESESLFSGAQGTEVLGRLGHDIRVQLEFDASNVFASDVHVKVDCERERENE
jgi:hypothetical protein